MLFKVTVNGRVHIVEAPSKSTAGAWGNNQLEVSVEVAKTADLKGFDLDNIPEALLGGKTKPVDPPAAPPPIVLTIGANGAGGTIKGAVMNESPTQGGAASSGSPSWRG
jgi:hypothetical protein